MKNNTSTVSQATIEELASLFEEFAQRLRGVDAMQSNCPTKTKGAPEHISYTTQELSAVTGVPVRTIRRMAHLLDPMPVGGRHGFEFPDTAPAELRDELIKRAAGGKRRGRKATR